MGLGFRNPLRALRYGFLVLLNSGVFVATSMLILFGSCLRLVGKSGFETDFQSSGAIIAIVNLFKEAFAVNQAVMIASSSIAGLLLFFATIQSILYATTVSTTDAKSRNEIGIRENGWLSITRRSIPLSFELGFIALIGIITGLITFLGFYQVSQMIAGSSEIPISLQVASFAMGSIVGLASILGIIPYVAARAAEITDEGWRRGD